MEVVSIATIPGNNNIITMNTLTSLCLAAVLAVAVWAQNYDPNGASYSGSQSSGYSDNPHAADGYGNNPSGSGDYGNSPRGAGDYGNNPHGAGGYANNPRGAGGYGNNPHDAGGYGNNPHDAGGYANHPRGYGFQSRRGPHFPNFVSALLHGRGLSATGEKRFTILDKLYERVRDVHDQVKTLTEQVDALSARLSIQEKRLKNLVLVVFEELKQTDITQNASISTLQEHLTELGQKNATLYDHIHSLYELNKNNTQLQFEAQTLWAWNRRVTIKHEREINTLFAAIEHHKLKLFQVKQNKFELFFNRVERYTTVLGSLTDKVTRRMCEVGQVTLTSVDSRVEYDYQNWFLVVPQIFYGVVGFRQNLKSRKISGSYYDGYLPKEPKSLGFHVNAYTSKTAIVLELFSLSFGTIELESVDVAFHACTFGTGTDPVDH